jgi:hypothetical protein
MHPLAQVLGLGLATRAGDEIAIDEFHPGYIQGHGSVIWLIHKNGSVSSRTGRRGEILSFPSNYVHTSFGKDTAT